MSPKRTTFEMLSSVMFCAEMLSVIMLQFKMLSNVMFCVVILSVIKLSVMVH
jgi:hypothetical protein